MEAVKFRHISAALSVRSWRLKVPEAVNLTVVNEVDSYSALIGSDILFFKPGNNRQTLLDALVVADEYLQLKC